MSSTTVQTSQPTAAATLPAADIQQTPKIAKVAKKRAARACINCRTRKVRCDCVETYPGPCNNCAHEGVECVVVETRRKKRQAASVPAAATLTGRILGAEAQARAISGNTPIINSARPLAGSIYHNPSSMPHGRFNAHAPIMPRYVPQGINIPQTPTTATVEIDLPPFIKPLPAKLKPCDLTYLRDSGAVTLPPPFFQKACLRLYVEYVHPYMPMMDINSFLDAVNENGRNGNTVSLLLFQAVMFAGITFVDEEMMVRAGYVDRRKTRALFFERVKKLYQIECEDNDMALIQSLLLMTYYYESPQDRMDTWHWIGVAISLAQNLGLHRNPDALPMSPQQKALHKRVWWSCYMRDRLIALGMRRPTRIKDEDFNVPLLEESDFAIRALSEDNNLLGPECTLVRDLESQRQLAYMCMEKAKLCLIISKMLKLQYSVLREGSPSPVGSDGMLLPKKDTSSEEVQAVDGMLEAWLQNLPEPCHYVPLGSEELPLGLKTMAVQRNLLHMVFYTAMSALHRPLFLNLNSGQPSSTPQQQQNFTQQRVRECADRVVEMVAGLRQHGLIQYLSTVGVTVILPAMIIKLFDMNNPNLLVGQRAYQDFTECLEAMHTLKTIYAAAEYAVRFMQQAFDKTRHTALAMATAAQVAAGVQLQHQAYIAQHQHSRQQLQRTLAPGLDIPSAVPENPSTPPPENIPSYLNSSQANIFNTTQVSPGFGGSDYSMVDDQQTPPGTDEDSGTQGESPSSSSDQDIFGYDAMDYLPNAENHGDVEFEQWITFNAEGVGNSGGEILDLNTSTGGFNFGTQGMWEQPSAA